MARASSLVSTILRLPPELWLYFHAARGPEISITSEDARARNTFD
ncbi:hypothetical protein [Pontibacter qinzhouensis]|nr:hypothetical protein [Pontibacter qinzhouensis]